MFIKPEMIDLVKKAEGKHQEFLLTCYDSVKPKLKHVDIPMKMREQGGPTSIQYECFKTIPGLYMQNKITDEDFSNTIYS